MRDRGRIKWAPFLIPEHKKRIAQWYEAEDNVKKPELDEQMLDQLQETIAYAIENHSEVTCTYHIKKRIKSALGRISKVDPISKMITISSREEVKINIPFLSVTNIRINSAILSEELSD